MQPNPWQPFHSSYPWLSVGLALLFTGLLLWLTGQSSYAKTPQHPQRGNVSGVTLRNVSITIDRRSNWNYSLEQGVFPNVEYDPSSVPLAGPPHNTRVPLTGWMPGLFVERVEGLVLDDLHVMFSAAKQPYWGTVCVNISAAEFPVTVLGGSCGGT